MKNLFNRKSILGLAAGAVLLAGTMTPLAVYASPETDGGPQPPAMMQHDGRFAPDPAKMAEHIADTFGVNKDEVMKYVNEHVDGRDIFHASFLAKASGKSLTTVMQTKTYDNTWRDVEQSLGVSKEQMKETGAELGANWLEKSDKISHDAAFDLLKQGYNPHDIVVANELAKNSDQPIANVLALKKINNSWKDVADSMGIDENTFHQDMDNIMKNMHPKGFPGHGPGPQNCGPEFMG